MQLMILSTMGMYTLIIVISVLLAVTDGHGSNCSIDWTQFGKSCYHVLNDKFNFSQAEEECNQRGSHLTSIQSQEEQEFIVSQLLNETIGRIYFGLNDMAIENHWEYTSNSPVLYEEWAENEPNNAKGNENCATLSINHNQWNDIRCERPLSAVCKKDIDECNWTPCLNNGTCISGSNNYTCICIEGFEGRNCETDIDDCNINPCVNNDTCVDGINTYTCKCIGGGFGGRNCETANTAKFARVCEDDIGLGAFKNKQLSLEEISNISKNLARIDNQTCYSRNMTTTVLQLINNIIKTLVTEEQYLPYETAATILKALEQQLVNTQNSGRNFIYDTEYMAVRVINVKTFNQPILFGRHNLSNQSVYNEASNQRGDRIEKDIYPDSVKLPKYLFRNLRNDDAMSSEPVTFVLHRSSVLYRDESQLSNPISLVIAASVSHSVSNLPNDSQVEIVFNVSDLNIESEMHCVFWNFSWNNGLGGWSREGCYLVIQQNPDMRSCFCDHLTNFAILLDLEGDISKWHLDLISSIGCGISIMSLIITICTYIGMRKLHNNRPQQILISMCFALLGLYTFFLLGIERGNRTEGVCTLLGAIIHYFILASVCWMSVDATNMYLLFIKVMNIYVHKFMLKASLIVWGIPLAVVLISVASSHQSYYNANYCYPQPNTIVFYICVFSFMAVLLTYNSVIFILIMWDFTCARRSVPESINRRQETFRRFQNAFAISLLLGLTLIFGFFAIGGARLAFNILFCVFNSLQGFFIFLLFCVRQKDVRHRWIKWTQFPIQRVLHGNQALFPDRQWSRKNINNVQQTTSNLGTSPNIDRELCDSPSSLQVHGRWTSDTTNAQECTVFEII